MLDMMTVFVYKNGEDTNGQFQVPFKRYKTNDIITFYGHEYKVINSNFVVVIVEEITS